MISLRKTRNKGKSFYQACGASLIASKESIQQHKRFTQKNSVDVFFFISVWLNIS